ncbi:MAG: DUF1150 family protein [Stellaceae bacterium]
MTNQELTRLKNVSPKEFALWGIHDIAYIRSVTVDRQATFQIHAADGTPVAVMKTLAVAEAAVRQNDLEPLSVH